MVCQRFSYFYGSSGPTPPGSERRGRLHLAALLLQQRDRVRPVCAASTALRRGARHIAHCCGRFVPLLDADGRHGPVWLRYWLRHWAADTGEACDTCVDLLILVSHKYK